MITTLAALLFFNVSVIKLPFSLSSGELFSQPAVLYYDALLILQITRKGDFSCPFGEFVYIAAFINNLLNKKTAFFILAAASALLQLFLIQPADAGMAGNCSAELL